MKKTVRLFGLSLFLFCLSLTFMVPVSSLQANTTSIKDNRYSVYGYLDMFLGSMRTVYTDKRHSYFYPNPKWGGFIGCNYNFFKKYFSLGVQTKFSFYKDTGYPSLSSTSYQPDKSTQLTRPMFPIQVGVALGFTPFVDKFWIIPKKFFSFKAWVALEYLLGQEQRESGDEDVFVDKIRSSSMVYGASLWILISYFDQQTANSFFVLDVKSVYLSPYFELTHDLSHNVVDFNRRIYGISVTFETL